VSDINSTNRSEAALSAALRELAHLAPQSAPPELGDGLMRAFRSHRRRRRIVRTTVLLSAIPVVFGISLLRFETRSAETPSHNYASATPSPHSNLQVQKERDRSAASHVDPTASRQHPQERPRLGTILPGRAFAKHPTTVASGKNSMPSRTPAHSASGRTNSAAEELFVALPSFVFRAQDEQLRVIRVNMPVSSLRLLGAPVNEEPMTRGLTTVDLLIGSDGTPYAVRLVM
jgi:hypothetical protein